MSFRFSTGNIVTWIGVAILGVAVTAALRKAVVGVIDGAVEGELSDVSAWLESAPWWIFAVAAAVGAALAVAGGLFQRRSLIEHDTRFDGYAEANGWELYHPPAWVWDSRTFPLDGGKHLEARPAYVGDFRGHWGTVLTIDNLVGPRGTESLASFQVIGLPFNGDMPRVHLMPLDTVEAAREMVGGERIDVESVAFNERWRVRGEDAKRVHDILHPRTIERLTRDDAQGIPIIIDGGAIWTWRATPVYDEDFEAVLGVLHDVATAIPAFLYADLHIELLAKASDDLHVDWVRARRATGIATPQELEDLDEFERLEAERP